MGWREELQAGQPRRGDWRAELNAAPQSPPPIPGLAGALPQPDLAQIGSAGQPQSTGPSLGGRAVAGIVEPGARILSDNAASIMADIDRIPHDPGPEAGRMMKQRLGEGFRMTNLEGQPIDVGTSTYGPRDLTPPEQAWMDMPKDERTSPLLHALGHYGLGIPAFLASLPQMGLDILNPPEGQTGLGRIREEGAGFGQMMGDLIPQIQYLSQLPGIVTDPEIAAKATLDPSAVGRLYESGGTAPTYAAGIALGMPGFRKSMKSVIPEVRGRYGESGMLPRTRVAELGRMAPEYARTAPEGLQRRAQPRAKWPETTKPKEVRYAMQGKEALGVRPGVGKAEAKAPPKAKKEVAKQPKISKEKWEIPRDEYVDSRTTSLQGAKSWPEINDPKWLKAWQGNERIYHRNAVRKALKEGKPVPASVLKDYPDLAKKPTKPVTLPKESKRKVKAPVSGGIAAVTGAVTAAALSDEDSRDIALAGIGLAFGATRKGRKAVAEKAVKRPFATMVEFQKAISTDPKGIIGKKGKQLPGMATRTTKGGNVVPSIRKSGVFVPEEVTKYKNYEDIPSTLENSMDPTRAIQRMDGSLSLTEKAKTEGQAGPMERNVSWRTRDMMKLRGAFISELEAKGKTLLKGIDKNERIAITRGLENKKSTNPKVLEARALLDELIDNQNEIRKLRNQKEIPYRHRYAPHILRRSTIWSQAYGLLSNVDKIMKRGGKDKPSMPDFILPNKPFNPREMARQAGLKGFEREMDFGKLLSQYINTAARDIFNTSIIENNKAFATQLESMGHTKSASFIQRWTAEAFAGVGGKMDRAIGLTAGTWPVPQLKKAAHKFRRALVLSAFPLNVGWNTAVQTSSFNFTLTKYGPINSARGAFDWFTSKEKRRGVQNNAYSYIIKRGGSGRMATQDISRGMASQARIAKSKMETVRDGMNFFTDLVENNLTGISVLAAKRHGENAGLKGKALWEYASDGGAKTQSMYNLEDLPGVLRNEIIKTGAPFQTFKFEAYNNLKEWSGRAGVKPESHKVRAKQAITFLAGAYAFNQIGKQITGREPWGHDSFIPFYDVIVGPGVAALKGERTEYRSKRGLPAPTAVALELGKAVHNIMVKDDWTKARKWGLRYLPGSVGIGGGTQINRVVDGLIANAKGGVYTTGGHETFPISRRKEKFRSVIFGPYGTTAGKEYLGKRQKSWVDLYRAMREDQKKGTNPFVKSGASSGKGNPFIKK